MTPVAAHQLLVQGHQHHIAGRYQQAEVMYRQVLSALPNHPDANYLLGLLALNVRNLKPAMELLGLAVALNPNSAQFQIALSQAHYESGNLQGAMEHCQRAMALNPGEPEYPNTLGS